MANMGVRVPPKSALEPPPCFDATHNLARLTEELAPVDGRHAPGADGGRINLEEVLPAAAERLIQRLRGVHPRMDRDEGVHV